MSAPPVWRKPGELQIGLGHQSAVLGPVPEEIRDAIRLMDGIHDLDSLNHVIGPEWSTWLIDCLDQAGVLADGPVERSSTIVNVIGQGQLAEMITARLSEAQVSVVRYDQLPALYPPRPAPALTIVAPATCEADRTVTNELTRRRWPHLLVRTSATTATIGPLVVDRKTACARCMDLRLRDRDEAWPLIVFQLAQTPDPVNSAGISWAAGLTVGQVVSFLAGKQPDAWSTTIMFDTTCGKQTYTGWEPHELCDCYVIDSGRTAEGCSETTRTPAACLS
jgi:bacteriocin biosynthesis cyclodehydratase domain-containing protein